MRFTSLFSIWFLLCACLHVLGVSKWKHLLSAISEWEALEFAARKSCLEKVCIMVPPERIKCIIIVQHLTRRPSVIRMTNRRRRLCSFTYAVELVHTHSPTSLMAISRWTWVGQFPVLHLFWKRTSGIGGTQLLQAGCRFCHLAASVKALNWTHSTNCNSGLIIKCMYLYFIPVITIRCLQCIDAVGWAAGRASGL